MGYDKKTSSENGRIYYFDSRKEDKEEMERVKPLLDLDLWARKFGAEALNDLLKKLASENTHNNDTYKLADCFIDCIENDGIPRHKSVIESDNYAFFMALIEELGIEPQAVKSVRDRPFDITLPMINGLFTVSVKPFDPYVPEQLWGKVGKRVDPRWHYFVSWAKYWDVILNSNSEYAAKLRELDPEHAKRDTPTHFSNAVMKKWLRKS